MTRGTEDKGAREGHATAGGATATGAVTGGAIGTVAGPLGAAAGAMGGAVVGAATERAMHQDDEPGADEPYSQRGSGGYGGAPSTRPGGTPGRTTAAERGR